MKRTANKKTEPKKRPRILAEVTVVCPDCGYETCTCQLEKRSRIKKSRHEMRR